MFCKNCGSQIEADWKYCRNCNYIFTAGSNKEELSNFATKNVRSLEEKTLKEDSPMYCVKCGSPVKKDWEFCSKCGTRVSANIQAESVQKQIAEVTDEYNRIIQLGDELARNNRGLTLISSDAEFSSTFWLELTTYLLLIIDAFNREKAISSNQRRLLDALSSDGPFLDRTLYIFENYSAAVKSSPPLSLVVFVFEDVVKRKLLGYNEAEYSNKLIAFYEKIGELMLLLNDTPVSREKFTSFIGRMKEHQKEELAKA